MNQFVNNKDECMKDIPQRLYQLINHQTELRLITLHSGIQDVCPLYYYV